MLTSYTRSFDQLTTNQLYEIMRLRSAVFVVEQNCVYQDVDNKDQKAMHVMGFYDNQLVAYARIFDKHQYFENCSIGRVVVDPKYRDKRFGHLLIDAAQNEVQKHFGEKIIEISAQKHLSKFYQSHGFQEIGKEYLEDGIPHIRMITSEKK